MVEPEPEPPKPKVFKIFVDANALLSLYDHLDPKWVGVLDRLQAVGSSLVLTKQIVNEVERNKVAVTQRALRAAVKDKVPKSAKLPAGLDEHRADLADALRSLTTVRKAIDESAAQHIAAVVNSTDKISEAFRELYKGARDPSDEVVSRARLRRERGSPPGKSGDPLGDQLSWEELLVELGKGADKLWIVTSDYDFVDRPYRPRDELRLNPVLAADLHRIAPQLLVRVLPANELARALQEFLVEQGKADEAFKKADLAYFLERANDHDRTGREPWECDRDLEQTSIEDAVCNTCDRQLDAAFGSESYGLERDGDAYRINLDPDLDSSWAECECGSELFLLEFAKLCFYCQNVWDSD